MKFATSKKAIVATLFCMAILVAQSYGRKDAPHDEKAENLKVLPKDIDMHELHNIMKGYCISLGVRCGHCHYSTQKPGEKPQFDFASDEKPEKKIARDMMRMEDAINTKYLAKMDDPKIERITCYTCHRGQEKPIVSNASLDSLKQQQPGDK